MYAVREPFSIAKHHKWNWPGIALKCTRAGTDSFFWWTLQSLWFVLIFSFRRNIGWTGIGMFLCSPHFFIQPVFCVLRACHLLVYMVTCILPLVILGELASACFYAPSQLPCSSNDLCIKTMARSGTHVNSVGYIHIDLFVSCFLVAYSPFSLFQRPV